MAGHSQFKNIMHRKGAQDKKKAKIFTKIIREITVAVKLGSPDIELNPRLRSAIAEAKEVNMPKENISKAIKRGVGTEAIENYEEIRYEGYGQGGVAIIVEALTDNRNRTASDVRSLFTKNGGSLGENGSVNFMFERVGFIKLTKLYINFNQLLEQAIEWGIQEVLEENNYYIIMTHPEDLHTVFGALQQYILSINKNNELVSSIKWHPKTIIEITDEEVAANILKLITTLEDLDDVQQVFANFDISDQLLEKITV
ncbi:YebC/PmpR family DNA-binding transcriptional regulator [Candidatus Hepatincolaceae symbiont of Richtersius coronifer]